MIRTAHHMVHAIGAAGGIIGMAACVISGDSYTGVWAFASFIWCLNSWARGAE